MSHPPPTLDNAEVLFWAWSGERPFGVMPDGEAGTQVFGCAVCRYANSGETYRFSCDQSWNVVQDEPCGRVDDPYLVRLPHQYDTREVVWMAYHPSGSTALPKAPAGFTEWVFKALRHLTGDG